MSTLIQDLKYGLRMLSRNPGFAAIAILTLALGIGANTAIFSMVNGILLRALPYPRSHRLYTIDEVVPQWTAGPVPVAGGNFLQWRTNCTAFSSLALLEQETVVLTGHGRALQVHGARASAAFFPMLGIRPELGRLFSQEEDEPGRNQEVILTHQFWEHKFHAASDVIGKVVSLNGSPFTVIGVLRPSFRFPDVASTALGSPVATPPEFFVPLALSTNERKAGFSMHNFLAFARLKRGVRPQEALAQLNAVEARIAREDGDGKFTLYAEMTPLKTAMVGPFEQALWMLAAAAAFVLLIICVNLANLMLVRNSGRTHEVAVRSALGATPGRLARQLLTEAGILAAAGGGLGLLFASWGLELLVRNAPLGIPRVSGIRIDPRVLWFTLAISVIAALLFALLPALGFARIAPVEAIKAAGPTLSGGKSDARLRGGLVIGEIALCCVMLVCALLLIASLDHVVKSNKWMDEQHVVVANVAAPRGAYRPAKPKSRSHVATDYQNLVGQRERFYSDIQQKVQALPGVQAAAFNSLLPLRGGGWGDGIRFREAPHPETEMPVGNFRFVSPGYFQAIALPLVRGRFLQRADKGQNVALISESVARRLLPGRNPIGMHVHSSGFHQAWLRVIGVVGDVRGQSEKAPQLIVYEPLWFNPLPTETLVVRTSSKPHAVMTGIRRAVASVSPEAAVSQERSLKSIVEESEAPLTYETTLGTLFAFVAVVLAALGLFGVISYSVSQRVHEIGIRRALGAEKRDVLKMVVGQGIKLALIGVAVGIGGALALTRFLSSLLYGVKPTDPLTFIAVSLILTAVALAACYIPARRATKIDPMEALRYE